MDQSLEGAAGPAAIGASAPGSASCMPTNLHFDVVLTPQRSLSPRGFGLLMLGVGTVSFVSGVVFVSLGAWPVMGFFGLDVALLYWLFRAHYRSGRAFETVQLGDRALVVRRHDPAGRVESWSFQPYWLRVLMDDPPRRDSRLLLAMHEQQLAIGAFLTPDEKLDLAQSLRAALARLRLSLID